MTVSFDVSTGSHRISVKYLNDQGIEEETEHGPNTSVHVVVYNGKSVTITELEYVAPASKLAEEYKDKYGDG